jgi:mannan endo-1,4-beta-mannosidase
MKCLSAMISLLLCWYISSPIFAQVNPIANKKTKNLYHFLKTLPKGQILFGHQDDLAYGVNWKNEFGRSDVKDCTGSYPAVFGWDVGGLEKQNPNNLDGVPFDYMKKLIKKAYHEGGINTISWHMDNPKSKGNSWDTTRAVHTILPGGVHHAWYTSRLDIFAAFLNDLSVGFIFTHKIPIIFRPFHEHTGSWFWWGKGNTSASEYKSLYRFTYNYLVKQKKLDNLIFCYSPDIFETEEQYLEFYPGDEYVDILGIDDYRDVGMDGKIEDLTRRLTMLGNIAKARNKVYAISETGYEAIPNPEWWTKVLTKGIMENDVSKGIAYVLVWRNANTKHHYAPYQGHTSEKDFQKFKNDPNILFAEELNGVYK